MLLGEGHFKIKHIYILRITLNILMLIEKMFIVVPLKMLVTRRFSQSNFVCLPSSIHCFLFLIIQFYCIHTSYKLQYKYIQNWWDFFLLKFWVSMLFYVGFVANFSDNNQNYLLSFSLGQPSFDFGLGQDGR